MKVVFIADFFADQIFGGGEIVNEEIINELKIKKYEVVKINSQNVKQIDLDQAAYYIIANFVSLSNENKEYIKNNLRYSIIEHDHKYVIDRDVSNYKNYIAPYKKIINSEFYRNAEKVYCQSDLHSNVVAMNLGINNVVNLSTSIWSDQHLDLVEKYSETVKNKKTMILGSENKIKNTQGCIDFCKTSHIDYDVVGPLPYEELMKEMAKYESVIVLPGVLETFNRFLVEARMLGCKVKTNSRNGCTSEKWFPKLKGKELIDFIRNSKKDFINKLIPLSKNKFHNVDYGKNIHFKIIVPLYNVEKWVEKCLDSIMIQNYKNFQCIIIDDMSTDNSVSIIKEKIKDDKRFTLVIKEEKAFALKNIYDGIDISNPSDEDVIINLDGDDWFENQYVLSTLCKYYKDDCLMTYGSHIDTISNQRSKFCKNEIPKHVIDNNSYRDVEWMTSALRTFKYKLWKNIDLEDLKNKDGKFYEAAWDLAYMYPMLEMAGSKSKFVEEIVYVYNLHDNNDHNVPEKRKKQLDYESEIRSKKRYSPLEMEINPLMLLTPFRFDVAAKVIYARHKEKGVENSWAKYIYEHHLEVWGGFTEKYPPKNGVEDFHKSFNSVLDSIKQEGFDGSISKIPITDTRNLLNGSHRLAAAIAHDKSVVCRFSDVSEGQIDCSSYYFRNKKDIVPSGLDSRVCDSIALEYIRLKSSTYMMTIYEHCFEHMSKVREILSKYGIKFVHTKEIKFNEKGKLNYVLSLYSGEPWIGNTQNNFPGVKHQASLSFAAGPNIIAALVDVNNHANLVEAKTEIRNLVGVGKPSIHTTDTKEETWRNATSCFNDKTIDYLNQTTLGAANNAQFMNFISETKRIVNNSNISLEDVCVVGSAPLGAYGKRNCKDFDVLHLEGNIPFNNTVSSHNQYSRYYADLPYDIIYNPDNHFYIEGLKFITPEGMIKMKSKRGEQKDYNDIEMFSDLEIMSNSL